MIVLVMRTTDRYVLAPAVTLQQLNTALNNATDRFVEIPLADVQRQGGDSNVDRLFTTPEAISHIVIEAAA